MKICNENLNLIYYRVPCDIIPKSTPDDEWKASQKDYFNKGYIQFVEGFPRPGKCKLSSDGSRVLYSVYENYECELKKFLSNRPKEDRFLKVPANILIKELKLNDFCKEDVIEWLDFFIEKLKNMNFLFDVEYLIDEDNSRIWKYRLN